MQQQQVISRHFYHFLPEESDKLGCHAQVTHATMVRLIGMGLVDIDSVALTKPMLFYSKTLQCNMYADMEL